MVLFHGYRHVFKEKNLSMVFFADDGMEYSMIMEKAAGGLNLQPKKVFVSIQADTREAEMCLQN